VLIVKSSEETAKCTLSIRKTLNLNKDKVNQGFPLIASFIGQNNFKQQELWQGFQA
jgi:hypothetical protein